METSGKIIHGLETPCPIQKSVGWTTTYWWHTYDAKLPCSEAVQSLLYTDVLVSYIYHLWDSTYASWRKNFTYKTNLYVVLIRFHEMIDKLFFRHCTPGLEINKDVIAPGTDTEQWFCEQCFCWFMTKWSNQIFAHSDKLIDLLWQVKDILFGER